MRGLLGAVIVDEGADGARRRPGDAVRVVVAIAVLGGLWFDGHRFAGSVPALDHFFDARADAPEVTLVISCYLLTAWALTLVALTLFAERHRRLLRDLLVAGSTAWVAELILVLVEREDDVSRAVHATSGLTDQLQYPSVLLPIATAVIAVASASLSRTTRRVGQGLIVVLTVGALLLGHTFPTEVLGAVALGWGIAALVHVVFGTSGGRPGVELVARALEKLEITVTGLGLAADQPVGRALFVATDADGPLEISALGRDEADAQFLARAWRYLAYRDAPAILVPTRHQQVVSETYLALLAREHGVRVAPIVFGGRVGSLALLVERVPAGDLFADLDSTEVTDALLDAMWEQVRTLHAARVTHGKLDGHHIVVDGDDVTIIGFEVAFEGVHPHGAARDVAEMLAATAASVGPERAVAAALRGVAPDGLARALPLLQARSISGWTHDEFGDRDELEAKLEHLRVEAARAIGMEAPELRQLYRVHPRNILMAVGVLVAVGTLLSQVGNPARFWHTVQGADGLLVVSAFGVALLTDAVFGITFLGNVPIRIPIWPSIELQVAMAFSNLAVPVAADAAIQVRFLQKNGLDLPSAAATGGVLSSVTEIAIQAALFVVALRLAPDTINTGRVETGRLAAILLIIAFAIGVLTAIVFSVRSIRRAVVPAVARAARTVWDAVKSPGRLALLIGGNVAAQFLSAASLLLCIHAFGAGVNLWTLIAINIGISTVASLVPIPGGGTVVSTVGRAGMLTAVGVPHAAAAAAVLTHQLVQSYLPAVLGWFAARDLIRKGLL